MILRRFKTVFCSLFRGEDGKRDSSVGKAAVFRRSRVLVPVILHIFLTLWYIELEINFNMLEGKYYDFHLPSVCLSVCLSVRPQICIYSIKCKDVYETLDQIIICLIWEGVQVKDCTISPGVTGIGSLLAVCILV
jgi:hypothetical protein